MRHAGQVAILPFPHTDFAAGKARPVLLLARVPGPFEDWLVCMFSTQVNQAIAGFDEVVSPGDADFAASGVKVRSVIRIGRLAVVSSNLLVGAVGAVASERLVRIRHRLTQWIAGDLGRGGS